MIQNLSAHGFTSFFETAKEDDLVELQQALTRLSVKIGGENGLFYSAVNRKSKVILMESGEQLRSDMKANGASAVQGTKIFYEDRRKKHGSILFKGGGLVGNPQSQHGSLSIAKA